MFDKTMVDKIPTKASLIEDLENIKDSLQEEDLDDDIPILTDAVVAKPAPSEEEQLAFDERLIFDEEDEAPFGHGDDDGEDADVMSDEALLRAAYRQTLDERPVLEGQQSLFEDYNATGIRQALKEVDFHAVSGLPSAKGENPFLPKHIRDRLNQGKTSFLEEMAQVSASLNKKSKEPKEQQESRTDRQPEIKGPAKSAPASDAQLKLVDELVAEYLPKIEKELRARLIKLLDEKNRK